MPFMGTLPGFYSKPRLRGSRSSVTPCGLVAITGLFYFPWGISGFCFPPDLRPLRPLDFDGPAPIQFEGSESRQPGRKLHSQESALAVEVSRRPPGDFVGRQAGPILNWSFNLEHHARLNLAFTPVWMCRNESVALFGKLHREGSVLVVERLGVPQGILG